MKEIKVITIYCIIDDILKSLGWEDDRQAKMNSVEVLTTAIIVCLAFGGNFTKALNFMRLFCCYVLGKNFYVFLKQMWIK